MTTQTDRFHSSTRRQYLQYGGTVVAGGTLAGCVGDNQNGTQDATDGDGYRAEIEPVGEVTFETPPERWVAMTAGWADMGIALGQQPPEGITSTARYHTHHYDEIPGELYDAGIDKELFYELDVDLHVFDPHFLTNRVEKIDDDDVNEIAENVAPFFGNTIFTRNYAWHDYRYYSMYEAFERLAQIFQEMDRYRAFAGLHEDVIESIRDRIPPEGDRPEAALMMVNSEEPDEFYPFRIEAGTGWKQWRDLGVPDALDGTGIETFTAARGTIGYETLLEIDPDSLLLYGYESLSSEGFQDTFLSYFLEHATASELTAVQDGTVYRAGGLYQGPIINLVLTERTARLLYPDEFGSEERLYDRQRVADIVNGDI